MGRENKMSRFGGARDRYREQFFEVPLMAHLRLRQAKLYSAIWRRGGERIALQKAKRVVRSVSNFLPASKSRLFKPTTLNYISKTHPIYIVSVLRLFCMVVADRARVVRARPLQRHGARTMQI
jgi:hypothetical protein